MHERIDDLALAGSSSYLENAVGSSAISAWAAATYTPPRGSRPTTTASCCSNLVPLSRHTCRQAVTVTGLSGPSPELGGGGPVVGVVPMRGTWRRALLTAPRARDRRGAAEERQDGDRDEHRRH